MQAWLKTQGFVSEELHWYVNYCCRDDFGSTHDVTSAWRHTLFCLAQRTGGQCAADVIPGRRQRLLADKWQTHQRQAGILAALVTA